MIQSEVDQQYSDILTKILKSKVIETAEKRQTKPLDEMQAEALECKLPLRPFKAAIQERITAAQPAVIAELKKASPSKGIIREDFDIFALARAYERGHATCLSVLTDHQYFQGHDSFLQQVRDSVDLPLLRKDFILEEYQVYESRVLGADAILLIAAALPMQKLNQLFLLARSLGLDVLVEVHSLAEYHRIAHLADDCIIGVNNRNLRTFEVNTQITLDIHQVISPQHWCVTESGISEQAQIKHMMDNGVYGFLIGEAFMRFENPDDGIATLFPGL